jgi:hypothetical protein
MTINRFAARKDKTQDAIVEALRRYGASVCVTSGKGIPDLLIGYLGKHTLLAEVKSNHGKLTPAQDKFHAEWRGGRIYILKTVEDAVAMLTEEINHD